MPVLEETLLRGLSSLTLITFILIRKLELQLLFYTGLLGLVALGNFTSRLLKQLRRSFFYYCLDKLIQRLLLLCAF